MNIAELKFHMPVKDFMELDIWTRGELSAVDRKDETLDRALEAIVDSGCKYDLFARRTYDNAGPVAFIYVEPHVIKRKFCVHEGEFVGHTFIDIDPEYGKLRKDK